MNKRTLTLLAALAVLLMLTTAWSWEYMSSARRDAELARGDLDDGLRMLGQIERLSDRSGQFAQREKLITETTTVIEDAAQSAGIAAGSRRRISSETLRRVGDTAYKEKPTQVLLAPVTMKQLVDFALALPGGSDGLSIQSIRLSVPREADSGQWTAELGLTCLIYDPPTAEK